MAERGNDPEGGRALLFERLEDRDPWSSEARPFRVHDRDGLRESVAREVSRILNTRCGLRPADLVGRERTVLEYGLPDWSPEHGRDAGACAVLEAEARRAIEAYEPRLREVRVKAEPVVGRERELRLTVQAVLDAGGAREPVSFPVMLGE
ncbi:MAG TPA: type VI secretion system baseplate subunit TssE [Longimicrobium sp.]